MKTKNLDLSYDNNKSKDKLTFRDLYEEIQDEINRYESLGLLDELMGQEVIVDVNDLNGNLITAKPHLFVGWLEGGTVAISSQIVDVYVEDED